MERTILIALDGATFTLFDPFMKDGIMPNLKKMVEESTCAHLMSTPHPLTPPAFTTMITGRSPGNHGLWDFIRGEEKDGNFFFTYYDSRDIRCETLWSMADRQGKSVTSLNFVMTAPVSPVNGNIIPGMVHWKHLRRHIHPKPLLDTIKNIPVDVKSMCWDFKQEQNAIVVMTPKEQKEWAEFHVERERQWFKVMKHLIKEEPTDLMAMVLDGVDKFQHICWEFLDPNCEATDSSEYEVLKEMSLQYYRELDTFLGEVMELAGDDTRVFITSDHGFGPTSMTFRINQFLRDLGHLEWKDDIADKEGEEEMEGLNLNWDKTVAYCPTRSLNGIYIRVATEEGNTGGIDPKDYNSFRSKLVEALKALKDPDTGEPILQDILLREEVFPGPAMETGPDITVVPFDHSFVSTSPGLPVIQKRDQVMGTHYPEGIIVATGPGIKKGVKVEALNIIDTTPALLYSLGLPIPSNLEGRVPTELFEPEFVANHPVEVGPPAGEDSKEAEAKPEIYDDEEKKILYERLRALGYVE